MINNSQFKTY